MPDGKNVATKPSMGSAARGVLKLAGSVLGGRAWYAAWVYMTVAGILSAFFGWMFTEVFQHTAIMKGLSHAPVRQAALFFAAFGAFLGMGLCAAEDVVTRAMGKAVRSALIGLVFGIVAGAVAGGLGQWLYGMGQRGNHEVVLVFDRSFSLNGEPLRELQQAGRDFVSNADMRQVAIGLVTFGDDAKVESPTTRDRSSLQKAIDGLRAEGGTNMGEGLTEGLRLLKNPRARRSVLFFTDGQPSTSTQAIAAVARQRGMTDEEWDRLLAAYLAQPRSERRFGPERSESGAEAGPVLPAADKKRVEDVVTEALRLAGEVPVQVAAEARAQGVQIMAIGSGTAERALLERIAGDPARVFFAGVGELAKAFKAAEQVLFQAAAEGEAPAEVTPARIAVRALCWALAGALLALGQGLAVGSRQKARNAAIGGLIGGLLGGMAFDNISIVLTGWMSRMVALCVIGGLTGVMMGIVEKILKDAWLRAEAGMLAGKEFVLYKSPTLIGASGSCHVFLANDPDVAGKHAAVHKIAGGYEIEDLKSGRGTLLNGKPVARQRLQHRDEIRIGQTTFRFCRPMRLSSR